MPGVLTQLRAVIGPDAPVLLGFDRGGAFPVTFTACRDTGADWVTYRRGPLADTTATPTLSSSLRDGKPITMLLADETVHLNGYGPARQLTLYEHDTPVLQILTSELTATGADLVSWLRARWRIENTSGDLRLGLSRKSLAGFGVAGVGVRRPWRGNGRSLRGRVRTRSVRRRQRLT